MSLNLPRLVVGALRGGSGKTTITLGLIQALSDLGVKVAPFKKGPDYIDPFWHHEAAGHPCRNLDPYMMGREQVVASFYHHGQGFDAALVEGNRGLFDGMDLEGSYSTAELAKWLQAPLVLAVDCSMTSRSVAAVVLGCQKFDPDLNLAGVVLNPVGTARQESLVRRSIEEFTGLPVLGAVPRLKLDLPERHMGLVPPQEHEAVAEALHQVGREVAAHVDVDSLKKIMAQAPPLSPPRTPLRGLFPEDGVSGEKVRIGVVRDAAFGFYYAENLEAMSNHGAELVFCSALEDQTLPEVDALYLGGGFPETHAARLAANKGFKTAVKKAADQGMPIYAECGGLMYLGRNILVDGESHAMAGVFAMDFLMHKKPRGHGYTLCEVIRENPFLPIGYQFRAHEFHYSEPRDFKLDELEFAYLVKRGKGIAGPEHAGGGLSYNNVLGSYHHVHALGLEHWATGMVGAARQKAFGIKQPPALKKLG